MCNTKEADYKNDDDEQKDSAHLNQLTQDELVRWMTEGTNPNMPPRSDCG
jgi:hypothetical protein